METYTIKELREIAKEHPRVSWVTMLYYYDLLECYYETEKK